MYKNYCSPSVYVMLAAAACFGIAGQAKAQVTSLSPSLSDPLTSDNQTEGFDSSFDSGAGSFTAATLHTDISDPTHSQLLGSSLTPMDPAYVSPYVDTAPRTGVVTDAQSVVGAYGAHSGSRLGQSFSPGASVAGSQMMRQSAAGISSMQASFAGARMGRASSSDFSGASSATALAPSGPALSSTSLPSGPGTVQAPQASGSGISKANQSSTAYYATDPVLTGSTAGYEGDLGLNGDLPAPNTQTAGFFAEASSRDSLPIYAFDDGQTPALAGIPSTSGSILPTALDYGPSPTGFSDSTRGLAGLASEASNAMSPLSAPRENGGLAASGGEGVSFAPTLHLVPSLHTAPVVRPSLNFEAVERHEQEQRILHGMSISQASEIYKEDLRKYQRLAGRPLPPKPHRDLGAPQNGQQDMMGAASIR